jgi:hypothetical protein
MPQTKKHAGEIKQTPYEVEMSDLRQKLAGQPYAKDVHEILPECSKAHIRNVVNGKCSNPLVLAALKIVVYKRDSDKARTNNRLSELAGELQKLEFAA